VFYSSEVGKFKDFNPKENPALGEEFFSENVPNKNRRS
jgi:hypothetical protein